MELAVGRLGAILGPFIGGALQQVFGGSSAVLAAIGIAAAGAAVSVLLARTTTEPGVDALGAGGLSIGIPHEF
jgi:AAHS family 4-hydroxybenzoate transporter-like MFS transporter